MIAKSAYTKTLKAKALALGFDAIGISKAVFLEEEAPRLEGWLNKNMHGEMHYMNTYFDLRLDPTKLVEGAKSVISLLYNYYPEQKQHIGTYKIAKYAYGEDYHKVVKDKLHELMKWMHEEIGEVGGRAFVDSAPVLEKAWAVKSGLGWMGKNTNIISKKKGSFFFLCELIVDLECEYDQPVTDHCGTCTACLDACPTEAIVKPYQVDGSRCISYFTIELKEHIPDSMKGKFEDWIFGCDICQDVCPWNRHAKPHHEQRFLPTDFILQADKTTWKEITEEVFKNVFSKSAVKRTKYNGLIRNIDFVSR